MEDIKLLRIEHVGSTAISDIYAKDIVDVLVQVEKEAFNDVISTLKVQGYILMNQNETRATFNKGYTEDGFAEKVFHIHLRTKDDIDELYFRDYLIEFSDIAKAYEALKLKLWKSYEHDRDGYTKAKSSFIIKVTKDAKKLYKNKYTELA